MAFLLSILRLATLLVKMKNPNFFSSKRFSFGAGGIAQLVEHLWSPGLNPDTTQQLHSCNSGHRGGSWRIRRSRLNEFKASLGNMRSCLKRNSKWMKEQKFFCLVLLDHILLEYTLITILLSGKLNSKWFPAFWSLLSLQLGNTVLHLTSTGQKTDFLFYAKYGK